MAVLDAAVDVGQLDIAGENVTPVLGVACVVRKALEQWRQIGPGGQAEVLGADGSVGIAEVGKLACGCTGGVQTDRDVVLGDTHDGSPFRGGCSFDVPIRREIGCHNVRMVLRGAEGLPGAVDEMARAAYADGQYEEALAIWERQHERGVQTGDDTEAAHGAVMVALYLLIDSGLMSAVRGWLGRAERHLASTPEGADDAIASMVSTYERFFSGDPDAARHHADRTVRIGTQHHVIPAVVFGTVAGARMLIADGEFEEGLARLDGVAALLVAGRADPLTTGMMYCELICAAQNVGALERAVEWTELMARWSAEEGFGSIHGRCRVHQAELLRLSGPVGQAEDVALSACTELRPWMRREFGWPLVELGNVRLRRGDLAGAEEAYLEAQQHGWPPQPGLALLRVAQGRPDAASELIEQAVTNPITIPSKEWPPVGELRLAPLLEAQAEIAAAVDDGDTLAKSADRLADLAAAYPSSVMAARAALARGRERLRSGDLPAAVRACTRAATTWAGLGATYDAAVSRSVLAEAQEARGYHELARLERQVAFHGFREYGARSRADELAEHLAGGRPETRTAGSRTGSFFATAGLRHISFAGRDASVSELTGFRHVGRLLAEPGREYHVLDLVGAASDAVPATRDEDLVPGGTGGLPVLDDQARAAYRRRLAEIDDELAAAQADHDYARADLAQRDRDFLVTELKREMGLHGRPRTTGSHAERARTSVTHAVRYALRRLEAVHPELASHLHNTLRTGTYCCYTPEIDAPVVWTTTPRNPRTGSP